jgi:hypothetical protein
LFDLYCVGKALHPIRVRSLDYLSYTLIVVVMHRLHELLLHMRRWLLLHPMLLGVQLLLRRKTLLTGSTFGDHIRVVLPALDPHASHATHLRKLLLVLLVWLEALWARLSKLVLTVSSIGSLGACWHTLVLETKLVLFLHLVDLYLLLLHDLRQLQLVGEVTDVGGQVASLIVLGSAHLHVWSGAVEHGHAATTVSIDLLLLPAIRYVHASIRLFLNRDELLGAHDLLSRSQLLQRRVRQRVVLHQRRSGISRIQLLLGDFAGTNMDARLVHRLQHFLLIRSHGGQPLARAGFAYCQDAVVLLALLTVRNERLVHYSIAHWWVLHGL